MILSELALVVPTRNNQRDIQAHLGSLEALRLQGAELVFVDSESSDGTAEAIRSFQSRFGGQFINQPPGLYAAWNAGVQAASRKWISFATVGDRQFVEGFQHLLEVACTDAVDAVLSPPLMRSGTKPISDEWPIHQLTRLQPAPRWWTQEESTRWLCGCLPGTVLGSAASNLYRRDFLLAHPFPTHFGHEGDVAWGIEVANHIRLAITPRSCAEFQVHERSNPLGAREQAERFNQLVQLATNRLEKKPLIKAELELRWAREKMFWKWILELEKAAETTVEQSRYIQFLEHENQTLRQERDTLSKKSFGLPIPYLSRGNLLAVRRFLRRFLS